MLRYSALVRARQVGQIVRVDPAAPAGMRPRKVRVTHWLDRWVINPIVRTAARAGLAPRAVALLETTGRTTAMRRVRISWQEPTSTSPTKVNANSRASQEPGALLRRGIAPSNPVVLTCPVGADTGRSRGRAATITRRVQRAPTGC